MFRHIFIFVVPHLHKQNLQQFLRLYVVQLCFLINHYADVIPHILYQVHSVRIEGRIKIDVALRIRVVVVEDTTQLTVDIDCQLRHKHTLNILHGYQ